MAKLACELAQGLEQTVRYCEQCSADSAHLLIFNRDPLVAWDDKIYREEHTFNGHTISVWGL